MRTVNELVWHNTKRSPSVEYGSHDLQNMKGRASGSVLDPLLEKRKEEQEYARLCRVMIFTVPSFRDLPLLDPSMYNTGLLYITILNPSFGHLQIVNGYACEIDDLREKLRQLRTEKLKVYPYSTSVAIVHGKNPF